MRPGAKHTRMLSLMVLVIIQAPMLLGQHATGSGFRISMGPMQGFGLPRFGKHVAFFDSSAFISSTFLRREGRAEGEGESP